MVSESSPRRFLWIGITILTFVGCLFVNYLSAVGKITDNNVAEVSDDNQLPITPAGWTFSIWGVIYVWQAVWMLYLTYLTCRFSNSLDLLSKKFYIFFILSNILNATWIFVWCNNVIIGAAILLILLTLSLYCCVLLICKELLNPVNHSKLPEWSDAILPTISALMLNGVAFYATWSTIAMCLNIGIVIAYKFGLCKDGASFISLGLLTIILCVYGGLHFKYRIYLFRIFSPIAVLIVAFAGILSANGISSPTSISVIVLLVLCVIAFIAKLLKIVILKRSGESVYEAFV